MRHEIVDLLPLANSGELTEAEEHQVAAHLQTCSSCRAEAEGLQQVPLLLSKLNSPATATVSQPVNPTTAMPAALSPRPARRLISAGPRAWALASAVVALIAAVGVFALTQQAKPATAAEIMARLAKGPTYASFHDIEQVHARMDASTSWTDGTLESWYKGSNLFYAKINYTKDGKPINQFEGSDGTTHYVYDTFWTDSGKPELRLHPASCLSGDLPWDASNLQAFANTRWLGKYFNYTLDGTEQVNGRTDYVLEFVQKPGLSPNDSYGVPGNTYKVQVWVDQQDGIATRWQDWDASGNLLGDEQFLSYELNPTLDDSIFALVTPAGATVIDNGTCIDN